MATRWQVGYLTDGRHTHTGLAPRFPFQNQHHLARADSKSYHAAQETHKRGRSFSGRHPEGKESKVINKHISKGIIELILNYFPEKDLNQLIKTWTLHGKMLIY